ncbi:iron-containing alcohol dehydrogenase [Pelotomaculum propionicicum]|uniref:iron-containing alcohol dehydrogenase n=1 Tax=Pelotomaculum propionicicum TaxID=258475 RepID=UPI003BA3DC70
MESFTEFRMTQVLFYGRGSFSTIGEQTALRGSKALIISDHIMEKLGVLSRCEKHLEQAEVAYTAYLNVDTEPSDIHVAESLDLLLREKCDVIVAVGGGSCIDTAKAVAVLASNGGYIGDYIGMKTPIKKDPVKLIVVPTTAGTGSEVTSVTVINNSKDDVKMMIKNLAFMPSVAIVDPVLTLSLPPHVTAATGIDALCHAVEGYISRLAQPLTDILALSAIKLIWENLKLAYTNGSDIDARENMSLAATQAGMAFSNSSVCLVHGMSRPIGAMFHVPHGVSNAMLLPGVLEFTKGHATERLAVIGRLLKPELQNKRDQEVVETLLQDLIQLCKDLKIPNMKTWGIERDKFEQVVAKMATDALASGSPANNPRVPSVEETIELYRYCYDYNFG